MFRKPNKKYERKRWRAGNVLITTNGGYLDIEHDLNNNLLEFHCDRWGEKEFENTKKLINTLQTDKQTIYLEWVQNTGSYYYFNLAKVIQQTQNHKSLDLNILDISARNEIKSNEDNDDNKIIIDETCYFDESISIETKLSANDILIVSPWKSMMGLGYTDMGIYNKHKLFLGQRPTMNFIKENKIKYIMNCCMGRNEENITKVCKERNFNVAVWRWKEKRKKYIFSPLSIISKKDNMENKKDFDGKDEKEADIKMNGKEYLDAMIDEINGNISIGNILIHCLAGAHRSPFITACFLCKYGGFQSKTAQQIYIFMKNRRSIVEELGFDEDLKKYQHFLKQGVKQTPL